MNELVNYFHLVSKIKIIVFFVMLEYSKTKVAYSIFICMVESNINVTKNALFTHPFYTKPAKINSR